MLLAFSLRSLMLLLLFFVWGGLPILAQPAPPQPPAAAATTEQKSANTSPRSTEPKPLDAEARTKRWLQSNDLLIETPYTQERGEVQHTFRFGRTRQETWTSTFEQEWPLWSEKHQLSVGVPSQLGRNDEGARGFGDVTLEYTYQLVGNNESRVTIAPKLGVSLPTGNVARELGLGAPGIELSVPVGLLWTPSFGTIANVSASFFGKTINSEGEAARHRFLEVGQGFVWYLRPRFNALLETKWERAIAREEGGTRQQKDELFVAPGIRWAHLCGKVIIAPGISFPIGVGPSRGDRGVMFSLVIEHGFGKRRG